MDLGATAAGRQRDVDAAAAFQAALGIRVDLVTCRWVGAGLGNNQGSNLRGGRELGAFHINPAMMAEPLGCDGHVSQNRKPKAKVQRRGSQIRPPVGKTTLTVVVLIQVQPLVGGQVQTQGQAVVLMAALTQAWILTF